MSHDTVPQYILDRFNLSKKTNIQFKGPQPPQIYKIFLYGLPTTVVTSNQSNKLQLRNWKTNNQKWIIETSQQGSSIIIKNLSNGKLVTKTGLGNQLELKDQTPGQVNQKWTLSYDQNGQMIQDWGQYWLVQSTSPSTPVLGYPFPVPLGSFFKWKIEIF